MQALSLKNGDVAKLKQKAPLVLLMPPSILHLFESHVEPLLPLVRYQQELVTKESSVNTSTRRIACLEAQLAKSRAKLKAIGEEMVEGDEHRHMNWLRQRYKGEIQGAQNRMEKAEKKKQKADAALKKLRTKTAQLAKRKGVVAALAALGKPIPTAEEVAAEAEDEDDEGDEDDDEEGDGAKPKKMEIEGGGEENGGPIKKEGDDDMRGAREEKVIAGLSYDEDDDDGDSDGEGKDVRSSEEKACKKQRRIEEGEGGNNYNTVVADRPTTFDDLLGNQDAMTGVLGYLRSSDAVCRLALASLAARDLVQASLSRLVLYYSGRQSQNIAPPQFPTSVGRYPRLLHLIVTMPYWMDSEAWLVPLIDSQFPSKLHSFTLPLKTPSAVELFCSVDWPQLRHLNLSMLGYGAPKEAFYNQKKVFPRVSSVNLGYSSLDLQSSALPSLIDSGCLPKLRSLKNEGKQVTFTGFSPPMTSTTYWEVLGKACDTEAIALGEAHQRNSYYGYMQTSKLFTGFAQLLTDRRLQRLKTLVLEGGFVATQENNPYSILNAIGSSTSAPALETLTLHWSRGEVPPSPEVGIHMMPGSLPRLRRLSIHVSIVGDNLRSLLCAPGKRLQTIVINDNSGITSSTFVGLLAQSDDSGIDAFEPLWLNNLTKLQVNIMDKTQWTTAPQLPQMFIKGLLRLTVIEDVVMSFHENDEVVVRFLVEKEKDLLPTLKRFEFMSFSRYQHPGISHGATLLLLWWWKKMYNTPRASQLDIVGLPTNTAHNYFSRLLKENFPGPHPRLAAASTTAT